MHRKVTVPVRVMEQRLSHFLMALMLVGTMTRPLLVALHTTPRALYAGVFFVVGMGGILGNNLTSKAVFLLSESRFLNPSDPLLTVPKKRIAYFLFWQAIVVAITVAMSQTLGALGFPVVITAMIPFRWIVIPKLFSNHELQVLDAPTADNPVVLASLGGKPELPEQRMEREHEKDNSLESSDTMDVEQNYGVVEGGPIQRRGLKSAQRQWVGDIHR